MGLRRNLNILTFPVGEWVILPEDQVAEGSKDWGGIWVARTKSKAFALKNYMTEKYGSDCRVFEAEIGNVLYENSYRIKTNAVRLTVELVK